MLKSALDYFGSAAQEVAGAAGAGSGSDPLVGCIVDVGGTKVVVKRRIGEGGFAFVYEAADMDNPVDRKYALKRLLSANDPEKRKQIVQEISILKNFSGHDHCVTFVTAAAANAATGGGKAGGGEEFLVLMEYCPNVLSDLLKARTKPYPPATVARIFTQVADAVSALHASHPPLVHRDLKLENLLIDKAMTKVKLCDFGSATSETFRPNQDWTMTQRTMLEEEMARHTTPMYRAPEMLDTWSNHPVDTAADIWALGCLLYVLCFHRHPFEDSAKLAIVNGNFRIPEQSGEAGDYRMFHDLIRQMLNVDPSCRPSCVQVLEHLTSVSFSNGIDPTEPPDFEVDNKNRGVNADDSPLFETSPPMPPASGSAGNAASLATPTFMSSIKGGAGSLMTKLRDKSQSVIQTVVSSSMSNSRGLDLHCVTERLAAMSFPADGLESATAGFRNHVDDVSAVIEARHPASYAVLNLSERVYPASKFPTGQVYANTGWKTSAPTSLETIVKTINFALDFLRQKASNVVVVHCLDGKSNTAVFMAGVLMAVGFVRSYRDALKFFALKRCDALLSRHHLTSLKYLESVYVTGPVTSLESRCVTLNSVILEPVPLYSKNQDGCRPYVEVHAGHATSQTPAVSAGVTSQAPPPLTIPPAVEYHSLKQFTTYDEEATLKGGGLKVEGDVTMNVFHARQSLSSFLSSSKFDGVPVCSLYFHTAFLPANSACVKFKLKDLDGITAADADSARIPANFKVVVNYRMETAAKNSSSKSFQVNPSKAPLNLGLIFASQAEHESNQEMMTSAGNPVTSPLNSGGQPVAPPRSTSKKGTPVHQPAPSSKSPSPPPPAPPPKPEPPLIVHQEERAPAPPPPPPAAAAHTMARPASDTLLLDLGFDSLASASASAAAGGIGGGGGLNHAASSPSRNLVEDLLNINSSSSSSTTAAAHQTNAAADSLDLFNPSPATAQHLTTSSSSNDLLIGDFVSCAAPPQVKPAATTSTPSGGGGSGNLLSDFADFSSTTATTAATEHQPVLNPSKPVLSPAPAAAAANKLSTADDLVNNLLEGLSMSNSSSNGPKQNGGAGGKPNYNSSLFASVNTANSSNSKPSSSSSAGSNSTGVGRKVTGDAFVDLLGGFTPSTPANAPNGDNGGGRTIGEMKKKEEMKTMTPEEAKVFRWKDGKARNLRALLCSLDTVLWEGGSGSRWSKCGMHQLVTPSDVKKMYRKACLAVHPDKQVGTENEELSKLIFMELNDAWSDFDKGAL